MARVRDTTVEFEKFARKAGLESPLQREALWRDLYEGSHPDVFEAFYKGPGSKDGVRALVTELSKVRMRVKDAVPQMRPLIEEVEPTVAEVLKVPAGREPLHVLMVGTFSTNAFVGNLEEETALFHCLEWFSGSEPTKVLVAHEDTHALHQIETEVEGPSDDLAWTTFYEGLAIRVSREAVPGRPEDDYFWYGISGFDEWLADCKKDEDALLKEFRSALGKKEAAESFFGSGFVRKQWRAGYYIADLLVAALDKPLDELFRMSVPAARAAIKKAAAK